MKIKIKKGKHYPFPHIPTPLPIWVKRRKVTYRKAKFMFTESCLYDLKDEDQYDINKLFGFSIGYHHNISFRFGWRPNLSEKKIEIFAYEYHDGVRQHPTKFQGYLDLNKFYDFTVSYNPLRGETYYHLHKGIISNKVNIKRKWGFGYTLGTYFGGNEKAPQDIVINKF